MAEEPIEGAGYGRGTGGDPLSFFAGDISSSSSEGEEDKNNGVVPLNDRSYYTSNNQDELSSKLPSPDSLFSTVGKPEFLTTHLKPHNVDWDKLAKNTDDIDYEAVQLESTEGERVSPPPLLDVEAKSEIAAAPVKYSIPPPNVDSKLLTVSSSTASAGSKRAPEENEGSQPDTKKQKGAVFREKEKRKRDLGMSSRGKSFVEEEKRILRQQFDM